MNKNNRFLTLFFDSYKFNLSKFYLIYLKMSFIISIEDSQDNKLTITKHSNKRVFENICKSLGSYIGTAVCFCIGPDILGLGYFNRSEDETTLSQDLIAIFFVCLPMLYMQISLGKYSQSSIFNLQYMIPIAKGLAYMFIINIAISAIRSGYYLMDALLYFLLSFQVNLPWKNCPNTTVYNVSETCYDQKLPKDCSESTNCQLAAKIFWNYVYMDNAEENTKPVLQRFVSLWICWLLIFSIVNITFFKKQVYFILIILFSMCFLLLLLAILLSHGSSKGISAMFSLHTGYFLDISRWTKAITKTTKTLALGQAFHILSGSYMTISNHSDIWCVIFLMVFILLTILYSILAFGTIGVGQLNTGFTLLNYTSISTYQMYFIYVPGFLSYLNAPQCWCILFFAASACLLILNTVAKLLTILISIINHVGYMMKYRIYLVALFCIIGAIVGSTMLPGHNLAKTHLFFSKTSAFTELLAATLLSITVCWIYSVQALGDDIHFILGKQPARFWKISWYLSPIIYTFTLAYNMYVISKESAKSIIFHVIIVTIVACPIVIFGIIQFFVYLQKHRLIGLFQSEVEWGVPDPEERHMRRTFNPKKQIRSKTRLQRCQHKCLNNSKTLKLTYQIEAEQRKEIFDDNPFRIKHIFD